MTEQRMVLVLYGTGAHNPFNIIKGLDKILQIADFNSRMKGNPADVIELNNRTEIENRTEGPAKNYLIETFTNQLYAYFLRRKQGEKNYK